MALILLADDSAELLAVLNNLLLRHGHETLMVLDGIQLVEQTRARKPHLIITDLMMPGAYGTAAYQSLQQDPSTAGIPTIFLTAVGPEQARRIVPQTPTTRLLHKPIDLPMLLQAIQELLSAAGSVPKSKY